MISETVNCKVNNALNRTLSTLVARWTCEIFKPMYVFKSLTLSESFVYYELMCFLDFIRQPC